MTKILLVEDDKSLREIYGVRLLAEGYDIVSAGDGAEALAMAIKDRPGLIVSDVMMPKISGFDMLDILRSTTETKDIKVIMMTALSSEEQRQRGVALGADRYLVKSQVGIEDVVRTVHEVLGDAPVAGQTPLMTPKPAPAPVLTPVSAGPGARPAVAQAQQPTPPAPAAPPAPVAPPVAAPLPSTPAPVTAPAPVAPATAAPAPAPAAPAAPTPTAAAAPADSALPQPTAPFSTPRVGTLADRVIQPLAGGTSTSPDFGSMMDKELSTGPAPAPAATPTPTPTPSGLSFEETPRPATPVPSTAPLPPPPQAPPTGV